jgi:hypothetical protein
MARPIADFISETQLGPEIGEPLAHRSCDGCVQCCIVLGIKAPELKKDPGVRCRHLAGAGCGIYRDRPVVCREFLCLWRLLDDLPEAARPHDCGVLFTYQWNHAPDALCNWSIVGVAVNGLDDFDHPATRAALDALTEVAAMPIHLEHRGRRFQIFPDEQLTDAIRRPETTQHRHLLERAAALRRKWETSAAARQPGP